MAGLVQALCTSYKVELMRALHDHTASTGHVFKIALFAATASIAGTYDSTVTNYSMMGTDELSGTGYTTGGVVLTNITPASSSTTAYASWSNPSWASATFTTRGALVYNSTSGNRAVCILDFGSDKVVSGKTFTVTMPAIDSVNAIVRIA